MTDTTTDGKKGKEGKKGSEEKREIAVVGRIVDSSEAACGDPFIDYNKMAAGYGMKSEPAADFRSEAAGCGIEGAAWICEKKVSRT